MIDLQSRVIIAVYEVRQNCQKNRGTNMILMYLCYDNCTDILCIVGNFLKTDLCL